MCMRLFDRHERKKGGESRRSVAQPSLVYNSAAGTAAHELTKSRDVVTRGTNSIPCSSLSAMLCHGRTGMFALNQTYT